MFQVFVTAGVLSCFALTSLKVSIVDLLEHRIPDRVLMPNLALVFCGLLIIAALSSGWQQLSGAIVAAFISCGFYLLLHLLFRGGIGFGDVKLAGLIGLVTGWFGVPVAMLAVAGAFVSAGLVVVVIITTTRTLTWKTAIPLGPFMTLGAWAGLFSELPN
jgi:leader peptidase (prepilin peptidase)/N-methyltransferase